MNLLLILIAVSMAETLGKAAEDGVESSSSGTSTAAETKAAKSTNALAYIPHAGLGNQLIAFVNANVPCNEVESVVSGASVTAAFCR